MLIPGDAVTIDNYQKRDLNGRSWFRTPANEEVCFHKRLSAPAEKELRQKLATGPLQVITVGTCPTRHDVRPLVALENECEDALIKYFYARHDNKLTGKANAMARDQWIHRWAGVTARFQDVQCSAPSGHHPPLPPFLQWKIVSTAQWRMPVLSPKQCRWLNGPYRFCPSEQYTHGFNSPSCTRTSLLFPCSFTASLRNNRSQHIRTARVVLHGFLVPQTWHFKFRTHVASASRKADEYTQRFRGGQPERLWWNKVLHHSLPPRSTFSRCGEQKKICADCSSQTFTTVHEIIEDSLEEYTAFAVTVFQQASTKVMRIKECPGTSATARSWRIAWQCRDEVTDVVPQNAAKLGLEGVCYDWMTERPTIHLFFKTLFAQSPSATMDLWPADFYQNSFWRTGFTPWSVTHVA